METSGKLNDVQAAVLKHFDDVRASDLNDIVALAVVRGAIKSESISPEIVSSAASLLLRYKKYTNAMMDDALNALTDCCELVVGGDIGSRGSFRGR